MNVIYFFLFVCLLIQANILLYEIIKIIDKLYRKNWRWRDNGRN